MKKILLSIIIGTLLIVTLVVSIIGAADDTKSTSSKNFIEQIKLIASDGASDDYFGISVAIDGNSALIGASGDDGIITPDTGSVYVFRTFLGIWSEHAKLIASDGASDDKFGFSVSLDGDYALIGAHNNDDNGQNSGSAYVFQRSGSTWTQVVKLLASDGAGDDYFGWSVSIDGEYALVGAMNDDDAGPSSGSAYVFKRDGLTWIEQQKLTASDAATDDKFGCAVSISGDYALVGAGNDDDNGLGSGSAYVFIRDGGTWTQQAKLTASDGFDYDRFGWSVDIAGEYAIIGAEYDDDNGQNSGSAYIFKRSGSTWTEEYKIIASDGTTWDAFGNVVAIDDDYITIGAPKDDENGYDAGSAYTFKRSGTTWIEQNKLMPTDADIDDSFGSSVAISGEHVLIGAYTNDDNGADSGSAYIFENQWPLHKMHYPQLPDPYGWDVFATYPYWYGVLADDWMCSESGYVQDIHFWGSWIEDIVGDIDGFFISIYDDIPAGVGGIPYSRPGGILWSEYITVYDQTLEFENPQGWYDPNSGSIYPDNHFGCYRYDIYDFSSPFYQEQGTIYWLAITANVIGGAYPYPLWGWKTSLDNWNDAAVWSSDPPATWSPLYHPIIEIPLDLAFVITGGDSDQPPTACYSWVDADDIGPGTTIDLDATCSTDDNGITSYEWDFDGDGIFEYLGGATESIDFGDTDPHDVGLRVTDTGGQTDTFADTVQAIVETVLVTQTIQDRGFPIRHAIDGDWGAGQNFTVSTNGMLTKVEIYLRKFGNPAFNLTVELRENHPQGTLLDTKIFIPNTVPSSWEWFTVDFTDTAITSTGDYFIVVPPAPSGVTTSFGYEWGYAFGDQYPDGAFWFTRDGGGLWRDLPTMYEFTFRTYGYN